MAWDSVGNIKGPKGDPGVSPSIPFDVQKGYTSLDISAPDTLASKTVTFPRAFSSTGAVVVAGLSGNARSTKLSIAVTAITATQFTLSVNGEVAERIWVNWVAAL